MSIKNPEQLIPSPSELEVLAEERRSECNAIARRYVRRSLIEDSYNNKRITTLHKSELTPTVIQELKDNPDYTAEEYDGAGVSYLVLTW